MRSDRPPSSRSVAAPRSALPSLLAIALLCGCLGLDLERAPPEQTRYLLDARRPANAPAAAARSALVLEVRSFHAAQAWANRPLAYRTGAHRVETDFYHEFLVPPGIALAELCRRWLAESGRFAQVVAPGMRTTPDLILEGEVEGLYGDYRDPTAPRAVLELLVMVTDAAGGPARLQVGLAAEAPLDGAGPDALVRAFDAAFAEAMVKLEAELVSLGS